MDKHLFQYEGSKHVLITITLMTIVQAFAIIVQAYFLAKAIVDMYNGTALQAVLSSFLFFFLAIIVRHFMTWLKSKVAYNFASKTSEKIQNALIQKIFSLGPQATRKYGSGGLITLALEGAPQFRKYLELFIPRFVASLLIPAIIGIYIFTQDRLSGVVLFLVLPILIAFLALLGIAAKKQKDAKWESYMLLSRHFVDSLRGLVTLKFLGRSKRHSQAIKLVSEEYRKATNQTLRVAFLSTFSLDFFSSLSVAVLAVELGLRLINGQIGFEAALMILILAPEYFLPIRELGNDYHATMDGKEAGSRMHQILEEILPQSFDIELPKWNEESTLNFTGVGKRSAQENRSMLKDISFNVKGYKKVGIIGFSGAGKSTIIDLVSGFSKNDEGKIRVNDMEVPHLSFKGWQSQVTYIPQHPYIFSGTIEENISWYSPNASREEIERAANLAGLDELIKCFPNGYNEPVGQGGRILSGGEEQRIALARAFLDPRPILILDEPTAHLDIETEHDIKNRMLSLFENKLVFFATHRLHWMQNMDEVFVLENGELVERGTHSELLKKNGTYANLVKAQNGGALIEKNE